MLRSPEPKKPAPPPNDSIKFDLDAFCGDTDGKKRRIGLENFSNGSKKIVVIE